MPSAYRELCERRSLNPDEWKKYLMRPVITRKCLLDMTDEELVDHYTWVLEQADIMEDRALLVLESAQAGLLERQAVEAFTRVSDKRGNVEARQVPKMLKKLRYNVSIIELHCLLRRFGCTEGFDIVPEALLTRRQWLWLVGECEMMKLSYGVLNSQEWFEICYESMISNLEMHYSFDDESLGFASNSVPGGHEGAGTSQPIIEKELMMRKEAPTTEQELVGHKE